MQTEEWARESFKEQEAEKLHYEFAYWQGVTNGVSLGIPIGIFLSIGVVVAGQLLL